MAPTWASVLRSLQPVIFSFIHLVCFHRDIIKRKNEINDTVNGAIAMRLKSDNGLKYWITLTWNNSVKFLLCFAILNPKSLLGLIASIRLLNKGMASITAGSSKPPCKLSTPARRKVGGRNWLSWGNARHWSRWQFLYWRRGWVARRHQLFLAYQFYKHLGIKPLWCHRTPLHRANKFWRCSQLKRFFFPLTQSIQFTGPMYPFPKIPTIDSPVIIIIRHYRLYWACW